MNVPIMTSDKKAFVPSRTKFPIPPKKSSILAPPELTQYQKRFVELYEKINLKLEENRKFYSNFNSLLELKALIENQATLLTGFQEGFKNSKGRTQREAFAKNVQEAISQLGENRNRAKRKLEELKVQLADLERSFTLVQEQERLYFQTLKEFQEAVNAEA